MIFLESGFWAIPLTIDNTGKSTKKKLTGIRNQMTFENTFARFVMDAMERYTFTGLPETISERVLLQALLWYGKVCIFEKSGALYGLPCAPSGAGLNIYGDFGSAFVYSVNGKLNEQVKIFLPGSDEAAFLSRTNGSTPDTTARGVIIRENALMFPFIRIAAQYAEAVADSYRTLDVVRNNIKTPYVIAAQEEIIPSVERFFKERDYNSDKIAVDTGVFDPSKMQAVQLYSDGGALTDATQLIEWYENKYRELCGYSSNSQMDKKGENLVTAEITVNNEYEAVSVDKCIEYIQKGLDDVNKIFGTSINVEVKKHGEEQTLLGNSADDSVPNDDTRRTTGSTT